MKKIIGLITSTLLTSLLLSGCSTTEEKQVSSNEQQTLKIEELKKLTLKQQNEFEQMKKKIKLLENQKKALENQKSSIELAQKQLILKKAEFEETQKEIENRQKDDKHSFYNSSL